MSREGSPEYPAQPPHGPPVNDPLAARLFPPLTGAVRWGLERTQALLTGLDHPLRNVPILHVGGTNGKGSVARIWATILQEAGLRVGLYTSPSLISFRERILVDGRPLPDAALEAWATELQPLVVRERPSAFEAQTALAFLAMHRADVDVAVLEVGLGGRLDATNVVTPVLTAITNVSMEHGEMLGATPVAIAREKAGILKAGVPAYTAATDPAVRETLTHEAASLGAPLVRVTPPPGEVSLDGVRLSLQTRRWGRLELSSPLVGAHQIANVALAVRSLQALPPRIPVSAEAVRAGVARARMPGRFQVERTLEGEAGRTWIFDVGHNPAASAALARTIQETGPPRPAIGVVGILADKDHGSMLGELQAALDGIVLTVPPGVDPSRRWDPAAARSSAPDSPGGPEMEVVPELAAALGRARELAGEAGTVLVTGSFAVVGSSLKELDLVPPEALPPSAASG